MDVFSTLNQFGDYVVPRLLPAPLTEKITPPHLSAMSLLFDVIADLPEGIAVMPVFAADKAEALKAAKEMFPGHRVTVVLREGEPGT